MNLHMSKRAREASLSRFCLSIAQAYEKDKSSLDGEVMADLASRLLAAEVAPGGPYIGPNGIPDLDTNVAVGYLFACFKKPLPRVGAFITIARAAQPLSRSTEELLHKYDVALATTNVKPASPPDHRKIFAATKRSLRDLQEPEKSLALAFLSKIKKADESYEIALLPTFFANSLSSKLPPLPLTELGKANILCWIAYSIYDKLLDGEPDAHFLPVANITMRRTIELYRTILPDAHPFMQTILDSFTAMDHANAWEITNCRFKRAGESILISSLPHYGHHAFLAKRSLGHILGPLLIAALLNLHTTQVHSLKKGLCHYLIARQLSDDIHDWQEDFKAGHASSVVTSILRHLAIQPGEYRYIPLLMQMKHDFWEHSMEMANHQIHHHLKLSRYYLNRGGVRKESELLTLHERLASSALQSADQLKEYKKFLANYRPPTANGSRPLPQ